MVPHAFRRALMLVSMPLFCLITQGCGGTNSSSGAIADPTPAPPPPTPASVSAAMTVLHGFYQSSTGLWLTTGWWNAANAVTVLAEYEQIRGDKTYEADFVNTFAQNKASGFINNFYDDEGWWALAWIAAYDRTQNAAYLTMAESIFSDMTGGWDTTCGGGTWWSKDRNYKNAIANELFLSVAASLALHEVGTTKQKYQTWAQQEWTWFAQSGMINSSSLVNDGLTAACKNNAQTAWSYNQGVILGGLTMLSQLNNDPAMLSTARTIATAAMTSLVDAKGILHDSCEPGCGGDGPQFKGIFVRNLLLLQAAAPQPAYVQFLLTNAAALKNSDASNGQFGVVWSGPYTAAGASAHISGLDLLLAAESASGVLQ